MICVHVCILPYFEVHFGFRYLRKHWGHSNVFRTFFEPHLPEKPFYPYLFLSGCPVHQLQSLLFIVILLYFYDDLRHRRRRRRVCSKAPYADSYRRHIVDCRRFIVVILEAFPYIIRPYRLDAGWANSSMQKFHTRHWIGHLLVFRAEARFPRQYTNAIKIPWQLRPALLKREGVCALKIVLLVLILFLYLCFHNLISSTI